ncbi:Uncharacterised protein [Enterobacter cloacae]|nr:Uncharacterised protein [Enterobacter cloacae]
MRFMRREQHPETNKRHNQPTGDTQTGNRNTKSIHHQLSGIISHHHNREDVDGGHPRLLVALRAVHVTRQPQKERHGR